MTTVRQRPRRYRREDYAPVDEPLEELFRCGKDTNHTPIEHPTLQLRLGRRTAGEYFKGRVAWIQVSEYSSNSVLVTVSIHCHSTHTPRIDSARNKPMIVLVVEVQGESKCRCERRHRFSASLQTEDTRPK
jgi:hypothetical protein